MLTCSQDTHRMGETIRRFNWVRSEVQVLAHEQLVAMLRLRGGETTRTLHYMALGKASYKK